MLNYNVSAFEELNTAGRSLMCQTFNWKAALSTKSEKEPKKGFVFLFLFFLFFF